MNFSLLSPNLKGRSILLIGFAFAQLLFCQAAIAQPGGVSGTVTNETGATLPKVSILVKETRAGTSTDDAGRFNVTASVGQTLVVSAVGYASQEVVITSTSGISIRLAPNNSSMDEVVVVGYTTQKRVSLTSAVSSISGDQLVTTKNENILNTMTGKIPGLRVVQNTSEPGSFNNSYDIRGMGNPLIVIDGIPRPDIARVDPNDVESISVMKDASAAIYGARAANGVILITTKKGKRGGVELNYVGSYGTQTPIGCPKSANAVEYMT